MAQSKEKILFIITKATWGGAQRYVYDLATHLPKDRFDVVVAYGESGKLSEGLKAAGIQAYQVRTMGRDVSPLSDIKSFWEIYNCIRKSRPDVVHLNSSKAAALGVLAARAAGSRRIIFTVHGWPFGEKRNPFSRMLIWGASWLTALLSHRVICVSDHDLAIAKTMPFVGNKAVRIYNGIAPMSFGDGEVIRRAFPAAMKVVGTIGELTHNKNHIALIERAKRDPSIAIAIVGEGELRRMLEEKIKMHGLEARVRLFGSVPAADVLKGFDVFALPSLKEGLPYVLLEARCAGIPIEANRIGGVGEALDRPLSDFSLERMVSDTTALY